MPLDKQTQEAIESISNGTLADKIKQNTKYATTGLAIGAVAGFLIASLTGRCKICFTFWGAIAGGSIGYLSAQKKGKNFNCCI